MMRTTDEERTKLVSLLALSSQSGGPHVDEILNILANHDRHVKIRTLRKEATMLFELTSNTDELSGSMLNVMARYLDERADEEESAL